MSGVSRTAPLDRAELCSQMRTFSQRAFQRYMAMSEMHMTFAQLPVGQSVACVISLVCPALFDALEKELYPHDLDDARLIERHHGAVDSVEQLVTRYHPFQIWWRGFARSVGYSQSDKSFILTAPPVWPPERHWCDRALLAAPTIVSLLQFALGAVRATADATGAIQHLALVYIDMCRNPRTMAHQNVRQAMVEFVDLLIFDPVMVHSSFYTTRAIYEIRRFISQPGHSASPVAFSAPPQLTQSTTESPAAADIAVAAIVVGTEQTSPA